MTQAAISQFSLEKWFFVAYVSLLKFYPDHRAPDAFAKFTWTECNIYLDNTRANLPFPKKRELERTRTQFWPWCTPALFLCRASDVTMRVRYLWPNVECWSSITWCITGVFQRGREKTLYSCARVGKKDNPWFETDNFYSIWIFALDGLAIFIPSFLYEIFKQY